MLQPTPASVQVSHVGGCPHCAGTSQARQLNVEETVWPGFDPQGTCSTLSFRQYVAGHTQVRSPQANALAASAPASAIAASAGSTLVSTEDDGADASGSTTNLSATVAPLHAAVTTAHVALVATAPTSDAGPTDSHALRVFRRCGNARAEGRDAAEVFAPQNGQLASSAFTRHAHAVHATKPSIIAQA